MDSVRPLRSRSAHEMAAPARHTASTSRRYGAHATSIAVTHCGARRTLQGAAIRDTSLAASRAADHDAIVLPPALVRAAAAQGLPHSPHSPLRSPRAAARSTGAAPPAPSHSRSPRPRPPNRKVCSSLERLHPAAELPVTARTAARRALPSSSSLRTVACTHGWRIGTAVRGWCAVEGARACRDGAAVPARGPGSCRRRPPCTSRGRLASCACRDLCVGRVRGERPSSRTRNAIGTIAPGQ